MTTRKPPLDDLLLAALAGLVPEAAPAPASSLALRARILADARRSRMKVLRAEEGDWKPFVPGIRIKTLRRDEAEGTQTSLWRIEPGAAVPPHPHTREEECLVLEGSVVHDGVEYFPGDYLLAPPGERHKAFESPNGALLMIRSELIPAPELGGILDQAFDIAIRPGLHCAPYVHRAIGTFPEGTVRVSPGPFNTTDDIDQLVEALREITGGL